MREIAAAAGVAVGAAYYYFDSKDALVMAFYEQAQEDMTPSLDAILALTAPDAGLSTGLNDIALHGGVRYLTSNPKVTRLSCVDSGYIQQIAPHLLFRIPFLLRGAGGDIYGGGSLKTE